MAGINTGELTKEQWDAYLEKVESVSDPARQPDLVERLRDLDEISRHERRLAADEIERLRNSEQMWQEAAESARAMREQLRDEIERLRAGLREILPAITTQWAHDKARRLLGEEK